MLKWFIRHVIYPFVIIGLLLYWLGNSTNGLTVSRWLLHYVFPEITIHSLNGCLFSNFTVKNLHYRSHPVAISAEEIAVKWKWKHLLTGKIFIPEIAFSNTTFEVNNHLGISPLSLATFKLNINLTPSTQYFHIDNMQGYWGMNALEGKLAIHFHQGQLQNSHAWLTIGSKYILFLPDKENGLYRWQLASRVVARRSNAPIQLIAGTFYQTPTTWCLATEGGHLPLALFNNLLPQETQVQSGALYITGMIEKKDKEPLLIKSECKITSGQLRVHMPPIPDKTLAFRGGYIQLDREKSIAGNSYLTLDLIGNSLNHLKGKVQIQHAEENTKAAVPTTMLHGSIQAKMSDLSLLNHFIPDLAKLNAILLTDIQINGNLSQPNITLHTHSKGGSFQLLRQGLHIKNIAIDLQGNQTGQFLLKASGKSDPGHFDITGTLDLLDPNTKNVILVRGKDLEIYHTPSYHVIVSPDLKMYLEKNKQLHIEGNINIPMAYVNLQRDEVHTVYSRDVRFIDENTAIASSPFTIIPDISVKLEDGYFQGYGFYQSQMHGKIHIKTRADNYLMGEGKITVRNGKYRLQRKTLYIKQGKLLYPTGTLLSDPFLDIRMSQKIYDQSSNNEVGLYLQGTLQKPSIHPYSNAGLKGSEILSQLGLASSNAQFFGISQAANILTMGGGESLLDQLQNRLGIEEINIESQQEVTRKLSSEEENDTFLVIGKSLSKDFYVQYLQGMFKENNIIRLKYFISPKIAFSIEKGTRGTGADILFATERD